MNVLSFYRTIRTGASRTFARLPDVLRIIISSESPVHHIRQGATRGARPASGSRVSHTRGAINIELEWAGSLVLGAILGSEKWFYVAEQPRTGRRLRGTLLECACTELPLWLDRLISWPQACDKAEILQTKRENQVHIIWVHTVCAKKTLKRMDKIGFFN